MEQRVILLCSYMEKLKYEPVYDNEEAHRINPSHKCQNMNEFLKYNAIMYAGPTYPILQHVPYFCSWPIHTFQESAFTIQLASSLQLSTTLFVKELML